MASYRFSQQIRSWYKIHKRDLPWRDTQNPYIIWLSEIILQQTRVQQGLPYFHRFLEAYPTVEALAQTASEDILKLWEGLGYYSRARNLHAAAKTVAENGRFPETYKGLKQLKGVGDYTAAAIASFAYDEPVAVVDGNVNRVIARYLGIHKPINSTEGKKLFKKKAQELLDPSHPAEHNQAIMEFGALHCVPKNPDCKNCPLSHDCSAYSTGQVSLLPVKIKKQKTKTVFLHYLVIDTPQGNTVLKRRPDRGIWAGLYEFPVITADGALLPTELRDRAKNMLGKEVRFRESAINQDPIKHMLTHRKMMAFFWQISTDRELTEAITMEEARKLPVHVLIRNFMEKYHSDGDS